MLIIFIIIVLSFPAIILGQQENIPNCEKLSFDNNAKGPESITFDANGRGPYTGITDGRIMRYNSDTKKFEEFSHTIPDRPKKICEDDKSELGLPICGRPVGLEFYLPKNELFIADAYHGLFKVGIDGDRPQLLATSAQGKTFKFLNGLAIDQLAGNIYFTDFSSVYNLSEIAKALASDDKTGRLLKYDYNTGYVTVLLEGLSGANGVALSSDRSYLLVAETISKSIRKFWLTGEKAFTHQVVFNLFERPDNIKKTQSGDDFWVAFNSNPGLESQAIKVNGDGGILMTHGIGDCYGTNPISEFYEHGGVFYVGSVIANFIGVLRN